jgi:hypothetical protein
MVKGEVCDHFRARGEGGEPALAVDHSSLSGDELVVAIQESIQCCTVASEDGHAVLVENGGNLSGAHHRAISAPGRRPAG